MKLSYFITICMLVYLSILAYSWYFDKNGYLDRIEIEKEIIAQKDIKKDYEMKNTRLENEIEDLTSGLIAIEELAREELALIKEDEVFYKIKKQNNDK